MEKKKTTTTKLLFAPGWLFNWDGENEEAEEEQVKYPLQDTENKHFVLGKITDICHCLEMTIT